MEALPPVELRKSEAGREYVNGALTVLCQDIIHFDGRPPSTPNAPRSVSVQRNAAASQPANGDDYVDAVKGLERLPVLDIIMPNDDDAFLLDGLTHNEPGNEVEEINGNAIRCGISLTNS